MSQDDARAATTRPAAPRRTLAQVRPAPGRRPWRATAGAAVSALVVLAGVAAPAQGAPPVPSAQEVDAARSAADGAAARVGALEAQLAAAGAALEQAQLDEAEAVELHHVAQGDLERLAAAAEQARAAADEARAGAARARAAVGRLAAGTYRSGGELGGLSAFLSADGPQDLLDRAALLDTLGEQRERARQQGEATEVVARLLDEQARRAVAEQQEAARAAERATAAAAASAEAARAQLAASAAARSDLIGQLAALRGTSVALEQRRQDALAAQQREREEAAARADRAAREAAARPPASAPARPSSSAPAAPPRSSSAPSAPRSPSSAPSSSAPSSSAPPVAAPAPAPAPPAAPTAKPPKPSVPTKPTVPTGSSAGSAAAGRAALEWARQQIGTPYLWGGSGPDGFDCSGLTSQAWRAAGVSLPRTSRDQYRRVQKIGYDELRPGDLVFYGDDPDDPASITHVAVYAGGGRMVEAPQTGSDVRETALRMSRSMAWAGRP